MGRGIDPLPPIFTSNVSIQASAGEEWQSFLATHSDVKSAAGTIKARTLHLAMRSEYEQPARWRNHCNYAVAGTTLERFLSQQI